MSHAEFDPNFDPWGVVNESQSSCRIQLPEMTKFYRFQSSKIKISSEDSLILRNSPYITRNWSTTGCFQLYIRKCPREINHELCMHVNPIIKHSILSVKYARKFTYKTLHKNCNLIKHFKIYIPKISYNNPLLILIIQQRRRWAGAKADIATRPYAWSQNI